MDGVLSVKYELLKQYERGYAESRPSISDSYLCVQCSYRAPEKKIASLV